MKGEQKLDTSNHLCFLTPQSHDEHCCCQGLLSPGRVTKAPPKFQLHTVPWAHSLARWTSRYNIHLLVVICDKNAGCLRGAGGVSGQFVCSQSPLGRKLLKPINKKFDILKTIFCLATSNHALDVSLYFKDLGTYSGSNLGTIKPTAHSVNQCPDSLQHIQLLYVIYSPWLLHEPQIDTPVPVP